MADVFEELVQMRRRGERAILATVVNTSGSTPRKVGAKMLIRLNGQVVGTVGGGSLEHQVVEEALELREDEPQLKHFELINEDAAREGMVCGGTIDVFLEPIKPSSTLLVFGGGHISFFLSRIAKMLGFHVAIIDDRPEYANAQRFPEADEIIAQDLSSAVKQLNVDKTSYIVIVTRGHLNDATVLKWAVGTSARYVGMIGSRRKVTTVFNELEANGISKNQLSRVHAPIGLSIGAETPEEIAVSIMAEIIKVQRQSGTARSMSDSA